MEILAAGSNIVFPRFVYGFSVSCLLKLCCVLFLVNETANFSIEAQRQMTDRQSEYASLNAISFRAMVRNATNSAI